MSNKKIWILIIMITIVINISIFLIISNMSLKSFVATSPPMYKIRYFEKETNDSWEIRVTGVSTMRYNANDITYYLRSEKGEILESDKLSSINGSSSIGYNITWYDKDNNSRLTPEDIIIIGKTGGIKGNVYKGYELYLCPQGVAMEDSGKIVIGYLGYW